MEAAAAGLFARAHLQALQRLGVEALPVERHAGVAVQHGGALVDGGGDAEVVVRLRPLLLPQVDLPDAVPAAPQRACKAEQLAVLHLASSRRTVMFVTCALHWASRLQQSICRSDQHADIL
jgi:hypothetical protein